MSYIPKGEIWVDSATDKPEIPILAKSALREAKMMASGKTYVQADTESAKEEKAIRKHDAGQHERVRIEKLGGNGKLTVYLVKGRAVRDQFDDDFTEGGHGRVYSWMPRREIWLDDATSQEDRPFNFLHELYEWNRMGDGESYPKAHHGALAEELKARRDPSKFKGLLDAEMKRAGGDLGIERIADFRALMKR